MTEITGFWNKNKVFILGLLGAIGLALQQFIDKPQLDYKVLAFALFMAVLSYFASQWRGQGLSITGIIGTVANTAYIMLNNNTFSWSQLLIQCVVLIIAMASPDPKSRGYENTEVIKAAKAEGERIQPSDLTSKK